MKPAQSSRRHGDVRGANISRSSLLFDGPFGRMFRAVPPADFGPDDAASMKNLKILGASMVSKPDPADPKDEADNEESGIPAAYTYLGQFIDHDLTFDPASSLQKQNDPDALVDYRTPRFDLDNIYGRGPDDQPYLYTSQGRLLRRGTKLTGAPNNPNATDLVRTDGATPEDSRAIIGDPRNDENTIVSQLQGIFHRFHNKLASDNTELAFTEVQQLVRFHYQWVLVNDFLPTIIDGDVLDGVAPSIRKKTNVVQDPPQLRFYRSKNQPFMPLEFSAAAYRFGHSMVRPGYRLNETLPKPLSIFTGNFQLNNSLTGFRRFPDSWAIDWSKFIDIELRPKGSENAGDSANLKRMQLAYKIDTSIVDPLGGLPKEVFGPDFQMFPSLAERNLLRGWRMRLPSGQAIARAMGLVPLKDSEILIGKFDTGDKTDVLGDIVSVAGSAFKDNCPLWTYVLAETLQAKVDVKVSDGPLTKTSRRIGPVGGRIIAETFIGLLMSDSSSYFALDPLWKPTKYAEKDGTFGFRELIKTALSD